MEIKTDLYTRKDRSILGQHVVHSWAELYFIEQILSNYHFDSLIEIGTYEGGLSLFFGLHALRMSAKALTIDVKPEPMNKGLYGMLKPLLPLEFRQLDSFSLEAQKIIREYVGYGRTLLYCDGGRKVGDFVLYAPMLKADDVIMAHDRDNQIAFEKGYSTAVKSEGIRDVVNRCDLEPFHNAEVNKLGGIFSFIKRR